MARCATRPRAGRRKGLHPVARLTGARRHCDPKGPTPSCAVMWAFSHKSRDGRMGGHLQRHGATGLCTLSRSGPAVVGFAGDVLEVLAMSRMGVLSSLTAQPSTFARPGREVLASLIIGLLLVVCGRIGTGVTARAPHPGSAGVEGGGRRPPRVVASTARRGTAWRPR